jgi:phosphate transport system substrate-binding protein
MYSKWFDEYHNQHTDIKINYQSIGSGGGIKQIQAGTVDFGASDGPMTDEQLSQTPGKVLHIPTVLGADVPTYNVTGVTAELKFTPDVLADLFLGKIKKWNDPRLAKANPGVKFPDEDIVIVHRSDGSGTTYIWSGGDGKANRGQSRLRGTDLRRLQQNALWQRAKCCWIFC